MNFKSIRGTFRSFEQLLHTMESLQRKQSTLLVGVDGCGGSGKSTFAKEIAKLSPKITIVHMDDFYLPSCSRIDGTSEEKPIGADFGWKRLRKQVLIPLANNQEGNYQRYDWCSDSLSEWHRVCAGGIVVIEGVYSMREELADFYDFTIFVDCPKELRLKRGIERDGEAARDMWENVWMVAEDKYMTRHRPAERADLVVDGCGNHVL
ncbi:uridine kinase [Microbacteriaceae bacterium 4G12]